MSHANRELKPGDLLGDGRLRLEEPLGRGATATVWRARDLVLEVDRAVKILSGRGGGSSTLRRRLLAEARAMAALRHPHILRLHDIALDGEFDYVVMDLADQGSLADWCEAHGPMPADMALPAMVQVLSALGAAHRHGIVHRDVKPQNILRDAEGNCLLADFGIARLAEDQLRSTRTGVAMGSLAFMAPEQRLDARSVTEAADIYAAGTTLYNLLTCANPVDLFAADASSKRFSGIPPELVAIIRKAASYEPNERFPSAAAMAEVLQALLPTASDQPLVLAAELPTLPSAGGARPGPPPARELRAQPRAVQTAFTLLFDEGEVGPKPDTFLAGLEEDEDEDARSDGRGVPAETPAPPPTPDATMGVGELDAPGSGREVEGPFEGARARRGRLTLLFGAVLALLAMVILGSWLGDTAPPTTEAPIAVAPRDREPPAGLPSTEPPTRGPAGLPTGPTETADPPVQAEDPPVRAAAPPDETSPPPRAVPPASPRLAAMGTAPASADAGTAGGSGREGTGAGPARSESGAGPARSESGAGPARSESGATGALSTAASEGTTGAATVRDRRSALGTWKGNVHAQRSTLRLRGSDDALRGTLTLQHPTTGVQRTVEVSGSFDPQSGELKLVELIDPETDPTAGSYTAAMTAAGSGFTGRYQALSGGRTAEVAWSRSSD